MLNISKDYAPPLKMVLPFFAGGGLFYLSFALSLFMILPNFNPQDVYVLGVAHLFFVGFVATIFIGAMAQLVPVILEAPHSHLNFYWAILIGILFGVVLLVGGFWFEPFLLSLAAMLILVSVLLYLCDLYFTILKILKFNFLSIVMIVSHTFLFFGILCGVYLAFGFSGHLEVDFEKFLILHVYLVLIGFMLNLVIAVAILLLPMFSLAHGFSKTFAKVAFALFSISPILILFDLYSFAIFVVCIGALMFFWQVYIIYSKRVRKEKDVWFKSLLVSFFSLLTSAIFLIVGDLKLSAMIFGMGFFGFLILGHLYKIVPFLVWFEYFAPLVGKQKVPMLHEMVPKKGADFQFWFSFIGFVLIVIGVWSNCQNVLKSGISFFVVGALFLLLNIKFMSRKEF